MYLYFVPNKFFDWYQPARLIYVRYKMNQPGLNMSLYNPPYLELTSELKNGSENFGG